MNNDISTVSTNIAGTGQAEKTNGLASQQNDTAAQLPANSSRQPGDAITLSTQARQTETDPGSAAATEPLSFSDHGTSSAPIGAQQLAIDASGSYKLE